MATQKPVETIKQRKQQLFKGQLLGGKRTEIHGGHFGRLHFKTSPLEPDLYYRCVILQHDCAKTLIQDQWTQR